MQLRSVVDNDVILKISCYELLAQLETALGGANRIGVLGAARFVISKALQRKVAGDSESVVNAFQAFVGRVEELEPTTDEIELATEMEEVANREALGLDAGESQLCAIAITRGVESLLTGDKRAVKAAESLKPHLPALSNLDGRIACLEQVILGIVSLIGFHEVRVRVCKEISADTALSICCKCWHPNLPEDADMQDAFQSYINNLRNLAPTVLYPGWSFPNS